MEKRKIPHYLLVDDDRELEGSMASFSDTGLIILERFPLGEHKSFEALKKELIKRSEENSFDGILMDLRLDGNEEDSTAFNGTSITQELRSMSARKEKDTIKSCPIVLFSSEEKIKSSYNTDKTSHDLFDFKIKKQENNNWEDICKKLMSLAHGYNLLEKSRNSLDYKKLLDINDDLFLDDRITDSLYTLEAPHDYAYFILKNFFHFTNPLLDEYVFAAFLGVDLLKMQEDEQETLNQVFELFSECQYTGVFNEGWRRWWKKSILQKFSEISEGQNLLALTAEKRVEILNQILNTGKIITAEPIEFCISKRYGAVCETYKRPIDPLEGYRIEMKFDLKSWQETKYISLKAFLEKEAERKGIVPHKSELSRIEFDKQDIEDEQTED